jgi:indoleamine 2,3-dioxygenase
MFRKKHWNLTKKYIIENTKHPVATGGTPITTWLPNQLGATLEYMDEVVKTINPDLVNDKDREFFDTIQIELSDHIQTIMDEVRQMQPEFKDQKHDSFLKR